MLRLVEDLPQKSRYTVDDLASLLDQSFPAGLTTIRLALDLSKDQFVAALTDTLGSGQAGVKAYSRERRVFLDALEDLGACRALTQLASTPVTWRDILVERLKSGRGSAIKGQARGRELEDFTGRIVKRVFGDIGYDVRCRFIGFNGTSTEKTDFAIPSKQDPRVLIESKAYGATGSKQTDILGDMARIVEEKRHDTNLLLVTDGTTWKQRLNDLRKLVEMQNRGLITRIYTKRMESELEADLRQLRRDHSL